MFVKKLKSSVIISVVAFFVIFFIFCGFAIDFSLVLTSRAQLQNAVEVSALHALDKQTEVEIRARANEVFNYSKVGTTKNARITNIETRLDSNRAVKVTAIMPVRPFFLSALGINQIELQAQAAAKAQYATPEADSNFNLANHIQYELDVPFLSRGKEIFIQRGKPNEDKEFRVFAGLSDERNSEEGIRWVEITCSKKDNWYGIDDTCIDTGRLGAAKYIRLSLDTTSPPNYYWDDFNIDDIKVLTSVKLIRNSAF